METRIKATGRAFTEGSALDATVDLLQGYGVVFSWCLDRAAAAHDVEAPRLRLFRIEPGSIDIQLLTEIGAVLAPMLPVVYRQAWDLYKAGYDLVSIATRHLKTEGRPMNIHIENSPGAVINFVSGDQVHTTPEVLDLAKKHHGWYGKLAALVQKGRADAVRIESDLENARPAITFDPSNQNDFDVSSIVMEEETPVEIACGIYRFNKRTKRGFIEYEDEDGNVEVRPFTIAPLLFDECLRAFAHDSIKVRAYRKMEVNALGESRIKELYLVAIEIPETP